MRDLILQLSKSSIYSTKPHQRHLSPSGRVRGRRDRFTPCENTRPAWQGPPDAPHRLRYCQAAHQPAG
ncbi:hypothetical protein CWM91_07220 [Klebsiella pneumoniae]|nr:hypothetical protein CWM91_07220 [Klebsiella pneumoniae]